MKKIIFLIIFAILIPFSIAANLKECQRAMTKSDMPCIVATSYLPSQSCQSYNYTIINQQNISLENGIFYLSVTSCQFVFNYKTPNIYFWNSSIESGIITIEKENNMIAIILMYILLIVYFAIIGALNKYPGLKFLCWFLSAAELICMVATVFVDESGGNYLPILNVIFYSILIIGFGLGIFTFFIYSIQSVDLTEQGEILETEKDKWNNDKW